VEIADLIFLNLYERYANHRATLTYPVISFVKSEETFTRTEIKSSDKFDAFLLRREMSRCFDRKHR